MTKLENITILEVGDVYTNDENKAVLSPLGERAKSAQTDEEKAALREAVSAANNAIIAKYAQKFSIREVFAANYVRGYYAKPKGNKPESWGNVVIKPETYLYNLVKDRDGVQFALENARYACVCYALQSKYEKASDATRNEITSQLVKIRKDCAKKVDVLERVESVSPFSSDEVGAFSKRGCKRAMQKLVDVLFGEGSTVRQNHINMLLQGICKENWGTYVYARSTSEFFRMALPALMAAARGDEVKARAVNQSKDEKDAKKLIPDSVN